MENVNKYHAVLVKISLYGPHPKKKKKKLLKKLPKASKNPIITVKSCQKNCWNFFMKLLKVWLRWRNKAHNLDLTDIQHI